MDFIPKSTKLDHVCYDIRGEALKQAKRLEEEGYRVVKLNSGNLAPFGFNAPDEVMRDMIINLSAAQGYSDSKGIFSARKAVMHYCQQKNIKGVEIEDIYLGNGVSELIMMSLQGLLNPGDEVLLPAPDYPLWTAAVALSGGKPVHYICDEGAQWLPDLKDIESKITSRTRGLVIINPNNPTGALYPDEILHGLIDIARRHDLIVFSDEIYDKILYDGETHTATASLADDLLFVTFNGLSKAYRACGFRAGWMVLSGNIKAAGGYREALDTLSSMRMCANVPAMYAIQTSLGGYQSINDLTKSGGRLQVQREYMYNRLSTIPGVSVVKPKAALYMFPKLDVVKFQIKSDQKFILDFLLAKKILLVQGTGFNYFHPDHFRIIFLPNLDEQKYVLDSLEDFLSDYRQK